jgi:hypothetical protein
MIPSVFAILIYQLLALLGAEAVSRLITYIAYYKRDFDFKLMYNQGPTDLIFSHNKFDKSKTQKITVFFFAVLALAFGFIPTIFTKLNSTGFLYYDRFTSPLVRSDAINNYNWSSTLPVFDKIIPYLTNPTNTSLNDMANNYLTQLLRQNNTQNPSGRWLGIDNIKMLYYDDHQANGDAQERFNVIENGQVVGDGTYAAFSTNRLGDSVERSSLTMDSCSKEPSLHITNMSDILGNKVEATRHYDVLCYPIYDPTMSIIPANPHRRTFRQSSLLNANDTIYRQTKLSDGLSAISSFGVAMFNHNDTHSTMAIKKSAHITMYNYNKTIDAPGLDCASLAAGKSNFSLNFIDLPYNAVLCHLMKTKRGNVTMQVIQAAGRHTQDNWSINTVYTHQTGGMYDEGESVMLDLTSFAVFNVRGYLVDDVEHMIAYESNDVRRTNTNGSVMTLANDSIGHILKELDSSMISNETVAMLMGLTSMRVRWTAGDYSDFQVMHASVMGAVETPVWWIVTVCLLALVFLVPHVTRVFVRRMPQYENDLRTNLISSLDITQSAASKDDSNAKTVSLSFERGQDQALLMVNGEQITTAAKVGSALQQNNSGYGFTETTEVAKVEEYELLRKS